MTDVILQLLGAILAIVVPIVTKKLTGYLDAQKASSAADTAQKKLIALGLSIVGKAWDRLAPQVQTALADGKLTAEERAAIEKTIKDLLLEQVSEEELGKLGVALGLPFSGVIAKVAAYVIEKFALAHDDSIKSASKLAYPVQDPVEYENAEGKFVPYEQLSPAEQAEIDAIKAAGATKPAA